MGSKRIAASIKYSDGDRAPRLSAYGEGPGGQILAIAAEVPYTGRKDLRQGSVEQVRNPELYEVVAGTIVYILA